MLRPGRLLALHRQGLLRPSFHPDESPRWDVGYNYPGNQSIPGAGLAPARHAALWAATQRHRGTEKTQDGFTKGSLCTTNADFLLFSRRFTRRGLHYSLSHRRLSAFIGGFKLFGCGRRLRCVSVSRWFNERPFMLESEAHYFCQSKASHRRLRSP